GGRINRKEEPSGKEGREDREPHCHQRHALSEKEGRDEDKVRPVRGRLDRLGHVAVSATSSRANAARLVAPSSTHSSTLPGERCDPGYARCRTARRRLPRWNPARSSA